MYYKCVHTYVCVISYLYHRGTYTSNNIVLKIITYACLSSRKILLPNCKI